MFKWIGSLTSGSELALDCGTGNGQAALGLIAHFKRVIAIDASESQLASAMKHPRIEYRRATSEQTQLAEGSVDAITVAQAFHWFDVPRFFAEARRVLAENGVVAVWAYGLPEINAEVDTLVREHYGETLGGYWPEQRRHVDAGYVTLNLPLEEIDCPEFSMETSVSLAGLAGYVRSWSATRRFHKENDTDPFEVKLARLEAAWGDDENRVARWPLYVRAGYFGK